MHSLAKAAAVAVAAVAAAACLASAVPAQVSAQESTQAPAQDRALQPEPGPPEPSTPEPSPEALAFVSQFSDDHLSGMLSRMGAQNEVLREFSKIDGPLLAATFDAQIDAAVRRHGAAWAQNLALAWSPLLDDAEMASLAEEGAQSPYAQTYLARRDAAGAAMAALSQDLFLQIMTEVLRNTFERLSGETPPDAPPAE